MMSKKAIRIISIILAALMALSVLAVLVQVVAADEGISLTVTPITGDNDLDYIVPIALIAIAVVLIVVCLVLPKIKKSKSGNE